MVLIVVSSTVFQCNSWALFRVWFQCGFQCDSGPYFECGSSVVSSVASSVVSSVVLSVVPVRFPVRF